MKLNKIFPITDLKQLESFSIPLKIIKIKEKKLMAARNLKDWKSRGII